MAADIGDATAESFPTVVGLVVDTTSTLRSLAKFAALAASEFLKAGSVAAQDGADALSFDIEEMSRRLDVNLEAEHWRATEARQIAEGNPWPTRALPKRMEGQAPFSGHCPTDPLGSSP